MMYVGIPYDGTRLNKLNVELGQITEMIHVASLIHDDVLDEAETRRGGMAVHTMYTNKVAVLAGDYLLAKASVLLARLQHFQVVRAILSYIVEDTLSRILLHTTVAHPCSHRVQQHFLLPLSCLLSLSRCS